jgi:hypothetical protein
MIKKITASEAECIIYSRQPFGLFYFPHNGVYIGLDNSNGHAWVEEFNNLRQCKNWLLNPSAQVHSMEAA